MANFTFSTNIPQAAQKISATQAPIQSNFQAINEFINVNHVGFTNATDFGKHNFTSFPFQVSDPSTAANEMAIYCKATPSGPNAAEIFYRYPNNGTVVQLTNNASLSGLSLLSTNGNATLCTNYGISWGTATGLTGSSAINTATSTGTGSIQTVLFTPVGPCPNPAKTFSCTYTSGNNFKLQSSSSSVPSSVYWWAIKGGVI